MFWMEPDVFPLRPNWVDGLVMVASKGDFWISGSSYLGDGLDSAAAVSDNWNWVGHINGNALYNLRDDAFVEFLRLVIQYEPPNHFWKPFDVSIWRVLHAFPHAWPVYQRYRSKFVYSNFIHHWGFHVTGKDFDFSVSRPEVFLVHGANFSAGNLLVRPKPVPADVVWTDRVPRSARLSIMIRSYGKDLDSAYNSVVHAFAYVPEVLEVVVVVSTGDGPHFRKRLNTSRTERAKIVEEDPVLSDPVMQQKWSKMHADHHCRGALLLHLDSHNTINAELQLRDLLWLGKPIVVHQRVDTLPPGPARDEARLRARVAAWVLDDPAAADSDFDPPLGLRVFPRGLYARARAHVEAVHGSPVADVLRARAARAAAESRLLSAAGVLGAFAGRQAAGEVSLAPVDADERRRIALPPPTLRPPFF
jgi:hypothetical protein